MNNNIPPLQVIISGGGTGGHIFPAISIANELKRRNPQTKILFVGASGRMEMHKVPEAGYEILGLPVMGFDRKHLLRNIKVLYCLYISIRKAKHIIQEFAPDIAIGVGGYASGPILRAASKRGIPTLLQEQNSYAGVTNKLLAKSAKKICVAYDGMERFFEKEKLVMTGNPVRNDLLSAQHTHDEAVEKFGLSPSKKTVLVLGGSLGARSINEALKKNIETMEKSGIQYIWQTGKLYIESIKPLVEKSKSIKATDFISDMGMAYQAADLVVSRAGAGSISELALLGKPVLLIPSPNVAEDHQTKNALALAHENAAAYLKDAEASQSLVSTIESLMEDEGKRLELGRNILKFARPDAASKIVDEVYNIVAKR